jgi:hypothetical protein
MTLASPRQLSKRDVGFVVESSMTRLGRMAKVHGGGS